MTKLYTALTLADVHKAFESVDARRRDTAAGNNRGDAVGRAGGGCFGGCWNLGRVMVTYPTPTLSEAADAFRYRTSCCA